MHITGLHHDIAGRVDGVHTDSQEYPAVYRYHTGVIYIDGYLRLFSIGHLQRSDPEIIEKELGSPRREGNAASWRTTGTDLVVRDVRGRRLEFHTHLGIAWDEDRLLLHHLITQD